jgi:hypothetical protein
LIAAFKDLIVDTNYRSEKDIFAALLFKWIKGNAHYYEKHSIKYSKINQLRSIFLILSNKNVFYFFIIKQQLVDS